jgi:hypothetical protein
VLTTRVENFEPAQHAYFSVEYKPNEVNGFRLRTQVQKNHPNRSAVVRHQAPTKTHPYVQQKDKAAGR